jgi:uncharacterized protein with NRDE domain
MADRVHPKYRLIVAANRDEFYNRPTATAAFWEDAPQLFAGRDLVHGGTWFGITAGGRIAALTNYRQPHFVLPHPLSRGRLVSDFLIGGAAAEEYVETVRKMGEVYLGFNLLAGDGHGLYYCPNRDGDQRRLEPGIYGLSNHLLDTPWPKVVRGKEALSRAIAGSDVELEDLFALLADRSKPKDEELPDTGVGLERERMLSSIFIESEYYGTRSSSVLLVDQDGQALFVERNFDGDTPRESRVTFDWS